MNATLKNVGEDRPDDLAGYDLVGIGSGIYRGKYHKDLFKLIGHGRDHPKPAGRAAP